MSANSFKTSPIKTNYFENQMNFMSNNELKFLNMGDNYLII